MHHSNGHTTAKCQRAGFLSSASDGVIVLVILVTIIATITLTIILRQTAQPSTKEKEAPAAATTSSTEAAGDESDNAPPPYAPPASSSSVSSSSITEPELGKAVVEFPNPKDTAPAFVLGTILLAAQMFALVTLGFAIQYTNYCPKVRPNVPLGTGGIIGWCFYALLVLFASSGLVSWGLLCWYVGGGKKRDLNLDSIPLGVAIGALTPFALLYQVAVLAVQGCQKKLCGVSFEEEQESAVEEVETDVEMQRLMKGVDDGDDDDEEVGGRS